MKRLVFILVIIIVIGGLIGIGRTVWFGELERFCKTNPSLSRFAIIGNLCTKVSANATLKCSYLTHTCENLTPQKDSGDYKITITVNGKPGKGTEVNLGTNSGPTGDLYVKTTDNSGVAVFRGIPPGVYYQSMNLDVFPKEYGDAYKSWTWSTVTITKGKTTEMDMDLHANSYK